MTFDFNFNFKGTDGEELKPPQNAAQILSNALAASPQRQQVMKMWGWVLKLSKPEPLELDEPDRQLLASAIEFSDGLTLLAKGQLLEYVASQSKK